MPFDIGPERIANEEVEITTNGTGQLEFTDVVNDETLTIDQSNAISELAAQAEVDDLDATVSAIESDVGSLEDQTSGLSSDGTEADLSALRTEEAEYTGPKANRLRLGVLGDLHWYNDTSTEDMQDESTTMANLDTFIDDMNNDFQADRVVVIGDLPARQNTANIDELVTFISDAIDYLENSGGSDGNGLDMPVEYVLGNHEYAWAGSGDMQKVYDAFGYSGLSDSWYTVDTHGVRLLILNTNYTETDQENTSDDHKIPDSSDPANEIQFVRDALTAAEDASVPVVPFVHTPVHPHDGGRSYDSTVNGGTVEADLAASPVVTAGFFGHVHHGDRGWDRVREERDSFGQPWLNCPTPHHVEGDASKDAYQKVIVSQDGSILSRASYNADTYPTGWRYSPQETQPSTTWESFADNDVYLRYPRFESLDGWDDFNASLSTASDGVITLETGGSSGDSAFARRGLNTARRYEQKGFQDAVALKIVARWIDTSNVESLMGTGDVTHGDRTREHIGIEMSGGTVSASVADGTTQNTAQIETVSDSDRTAVLLVFRPGNSLTVHRLDDSHKVDAELTSNLPSGTLTDDILAFSVETQTSASKRLDIEHTEVYIGRIPQEFADKTVRNVAALR